MGKSFEIKSAYYGKSTKHDVDITDYLLQNRYIKPKSNNMTELFGDPFPNSPKYVQVKFTVTDERTEVFEEDSFMIKKGGGRIGFDDNIPFEIDLPNLYRYRVLDAAFEITGMIVRPAQYANPEEVVVIPPSDFGTFVKHTEDGYYVVQERVDLVEWMGCDPFPYRQKVIELSYRRQVSYYVQVFELGGYLLKDLILCVELPLQRLNMVYHLFPIWNHHLFALHKRYLDKCRDIFSSITVCLAHESEEERETNERAAHQLFEYAPQLEIVHMESSKTLKEGASFQSLLETSSQHGSEYTFYCHSKGFTQYQMLILPNVACWVELSYIQALANIDVVIEQNTPLAGSFLQHHTVDDKIVSWHYSGNFYWIKSSLLPPYIAQPHKTSSELAKEFPKNVTSDMSQCLDFLPTKDGMTDLYNRQCVLQFKTLIEMCCKDTISRKTVGLL